MLYETDDQSYDATEDHLEREFLDSAEFHNLPQKRQLETERQLEGSDPMQEDTHAERDSVLN